jgi:death-on-curing protein
VQTTFYPTLEEIIYLHTRLIKRFGGEPGVRDPGLIESALHRPRSEYYRTLSEQAAALLQSLSLNHAFVDGNKRVAFATCAIFLLLNGYEMKVDAIAAERFMVSRVISGHADLLEIARWIEKTLSSAPPA